MMTDAEILLTLKFGEKLFVNPRRMELLKAILQTGSLSQAAKLIGMSYKTAWDAINEINQLATSPLVKTSIGGKGGGGAELSQYAKRFIELYDLLTKMQSNAFNTLKDESIPLDDILKVAAMVSWQSSARNQLYATIKTINIHDVAGFVTVILQDNKTQVKVKITHSSLIRLQLMVGKKVMLLIKAPQVEIAKICEHNNYLARVNKITQSQQWIELELSVNEQIIIYATKQIDNISEIDISPDQLINININPDNIIITTLI